ncbi:MAG TPA: hypothetical protein V6C76_12905 [Drouetiella sp.]
MISRSLVLLTAFALVGQQSCALAQGTSSSDTTVMLSIHRDVNLNADGSDKFQSDEHSSNESTAPNLSASKVVSGSVQDWRANNLSDIVDNIIDTHFHSDKQAIALEKSVEHYRSAAQVLLAKSKDSLNYSLPYQGVNPSRRMGKLVLSDEALIRDAASAEYAKQVYVDKLHGQVVTCLMQIASALGSHDAREKNSLLASAQEQLETYVGSSAAAHANALLQKMIEQSADRSLEGADHKWGPIERQNKIDQIVTAAMNKDVVVIELKKRVDNYAHPNAFKSKCSGAIESALSAATWVAPGFAIPLGCEAALNAYVLATGGSEEGKIERTLLYSKRLDSRKRLYEREASLAVDSFGYAVSTNNVALASFSKALVVELSSADDASTVFGDSTAVDMNVAPQIKIIKKNKDKA